MLFRSGLRHEVECCSSPHQKYFSNLLCNRNQQMADNNMLDIPAAWIESPDSVRIDDPAQVSRSAFSAPLMTGRRHRNDSIMDYRFSIHFDKIT